MSINFKSVQIASMQVYCLILILLALLWIGFAFVFNTVTMFCFLYPAHNLDSQERDSDEHKLEEEVLDEAANFNDQMSPIPGIDE